MQLAGDRTPIGDGEEAIAANPTGFHRLFANAICLLAGFDLLAKLAAGDCRGVAARFKDFLATYAALSEDDQRATYALRNALIHSYGLAGDPSASSKPVPVPRLRRECARGPTDRSPVWDDGGRAVVCMQHLYRLFLASIAEYRRQLDADADLRATFAGMFTQYGFVQIEPDDR